MQSRLSHHDVYYKVNTASISKSNVHFINIRLDVILQSLKGSVAMWKMIVWIKKFYQNIKLYVYYD